MARHRAKNTAATKSQLDVLRWWQLMLKDLATSYPDIQLADSAGFSPLIEGEKKIHQSMKAKICFFTTELGKEFKFLKAICLFQFRVNNSKTNFISHVNVKSR